MGIETSTPSATWGSRPIAMNSVVPMANPPTASARTAGPYRAGRTGAAVVAVLPDCVVVMLIPV